LENTLLSSLPESSGGRKTVLSFYLFEFLFWWLINGLCPFHANPVWWAPEFNEVPANYAAGCRWSSTILKRLRNE
jgi:hypothetical protein